MDEILVAEVDDDNSGGARRGGRHHQRPLALEGMGCDGLLSSARRYQCGGDAFDSDDDGGDLLYSDHDEWDSARALGRCVVQIESDGDSGTATIDDSEGDRGPAERACLDVARAARARADENARRDEADAEAARRGAAGAAGVEALQASAAHTEATRIARLRDVSDAEQARRDTLRADVCAAESAIPVLPTVTDRVPSAAATARRGGGSQTTTD